MTTLRLVLIAVMVFPVAIGIVAQPPRPGGAPPQYPRLLERYPILRKMIESQNRLRYSGTRVVEIRIGPDRERNTEIILRDGALQRTEFTPDSPNAGQIIVENARMRRHFFPATNEVQVLPPRRDEVQSRMRLLLRQINDGSLRLRVEPGGEVAARRTQLAHFEDSKGNPVQRLWIDGETGMLLKRELFDLVGTRIGFFEWKRINYRPTFSAGDFEIVRKGARVVTLDDQIRMMSRRLGIPPVRLPDADGLHLESVRPLDLGSSRAMMQTYTGERGRVSLYHFAASIDPQRLRRLAGDSNLGVYSWESGGRTLALIGDLPTPELERLAKTIR